MSKHEIQVSEVESELDDQAKCEADAAEAERIFTTVSNTDIFLMIKNDQMTFDVFAALLDKISVNGFDSGYDLGLFMGEGT